MEWMILPLKRYADFQGRSRRKEYWMFLLGYVLFFAVLIGLAFTFGWSPRRAEFDGLAMIPLLILGVAGLGLLIPSLAVQVRRLHDQDMSGWWLLLYYLIAWIPIIGSIATIAMVVFMCIPGTRGPNRFGPDPLDPNGIEQAERVFG